MKPKLITPDDDPLSQILHMRVWDPKTDAIGRILSQHLKLVGKGSRSKFKVRRTTYILDSRNGVLHAQCYGVN